MLSKHIEYSRVTPPCLQALLQVMLPGAVAGPPPTPASKQHAPRPSPASPSVAPAEAGGLAAPAYSQPAATAAGPGPSMATAAGPAAALERLLTCPLTHQRFVEPVIAGDGVSYEREALELWLVPNPGVSPRDGGILPAAPAPRLNLALRDFLSTLA